MRMDKRYSATFAGYEFAWSVLTTRGVVVPCEAETSSEPDGLTIRATKCCLFADRNRPYEGSTEMRVVQKADGGISWQANASMNDPIKGIKVEVGPVPGNGVMAGGGSAIQIEDGRAYSTVFPCGYHPFQKIPQSGVRYTGTNIGQFLFITREDGILMLRSEDYPPRYQRYWLFRNGDQCKLMVYLEANACERKPQCSTPTWYLEPVKDINAGMVRHVEWMKKAYGTKPLAERDDAPDWVRNICMNVTFHCRASHGKVLHTFPQMEERLRQIAERFDPHRTQLHIVGWDGPWDWTWPAHEPDPVLGGRDGFLRMTDTAHELGYHVGLHMNAMGLSYLNPDFDKIKHFLEHQCRDAEGSPLGWQYDWDGDDQDEQIFAYISPDHKPWREYLRSQILAVVHDFGIDIVHLDQATTQINDINHNHWRGLCALFQELRAELPPHVSLSGEGSGESVAHLYPLCGYMTGDRPEVARNMITQFVRSFDYGAPPEPPHGGLTYRAFGRGKWSKERFYRRLERCERLGLVPTLHLSDYHVGVDSQEACAIYEAARRFQARLEE